MQSHLINISGVVSPEDAAEILGCKRTHVFALIRRGGLKRAPKIGREIRITLASVRALLDLDDDAPSVRRYRRRRAEPPHG